MIKSERKLVRKIQDGDVKAWEEFKRTATPIILRYMQPRYDDKNIEIPNKLVDIADKVEDHIELVEYILEGAYKYLKKNELQKSLEQFLYRPTKFAIYRHSRKFGKSTFTVDFGSDPSWTQKPDNKPNPEQSMIDQDFANELKMDRSFLKTCLEKLTKTQGTVIKLWVRHGSWKKVAEIRKVAPAAISQVKEKAFNKLRECIGELRRIHETA